MPIQPSSYSSGPLAPQQINQDLYGIPGAPSGVRFHTRRPLLFETVVSGGTAYTSLVPQPIAGAGLIASPMVDTTALAGIGADNPGVGAKFTFQNWVPASGGNPGLFAGRWLTWNFPYTAPVTVPPGGVGAGMTNNSSFNNIGTFQYGNTGHFNCPFHLDLIAPGAGSVNTWKPSFYWLTPSTPVIEGNADDTTGPTTRMGFLWQSVTAGTGGTVSAIPSVSQTWDPVTSAALNGMSSALTFLNNPPTFRVSGTAAQSIGNATVAVLGLHSTPDYDNYSGWSTALANYTAPLQGLYLMSPTVVWGTASSTSFRYCGLQVTAGGTTTNYQGPSYAATQVGPGTTGTGLTSTAAVRVLSLNQGDKVAGYGFQNSGGALSLYTGFQTRLIGAHMSPRAASGTVLTYTPPPVGFRFTAGTGPGTALTASLNARIGGDLNFLLNRPYLTAYQSAPQGSFANNSGFHQVNMDTLGALPRGGNGDNYAGWSTANHWYVSQVPGWYLVMAELFATVPSATTATLTAGISCSSSGGIAPSTSPDAYQQVVYPLTGAGGPQPGAYAMGVYYLLPGEHVHPVLQAQDWGGTWGTFANVGAATVVASQFSCFWLSS